MRTKESAIPATQVDTLLTRKAIGEGLFSLLEDFGVISAHEEVCLPHNKAGELDPRVEIVRDRDIQANRRVLLPLELTAENLTPRLTARVPELAQPITDVTVEGVAWSRKKSGTQYLSLCLDDDTTERLGEEQAAIWEALPGVSGMDTQRESLKWELYDPRMLIIAFGANVPYSPIARTRLHILRQLPFELTLLPVGEARDVF